MIQVATLIIPLSLLSKKIVFIEEPFGYIRANKVEDVLDVENIPTLELMNLRERILSRTSFEQGVIGIKASKKGNILRSVSRIVAFDLKVGEKVTEGDEELTNILKNIFSIEEMERKYDVPEYEYLLDSGLIKKYELDKKRIDKYYKNKKNKNPKRILADYSDRELSNKAIVIYK